MKINFTLTSPNIEKLKDFLTGLVMVFIHERRILFFDATAKVWTRPISIFITFSLIEAFSCLFFPIVAFFVRFKCLIAIIMGLEEVQQRFGELSCLFKFIIWKLDLYVFIFFFFFFVLVIFNLRIFI